MLTKDTWVRGTRKGIGTALELGKVVLPVSIIVALLRETVIIGWISDFFAPAMAWFGLPGEASLALVLGNLVNMYAALGVIMGLSLTAKQITIIGIMLSFAHSMIIETAVARRIGLRAHWIIMLRLSLAVVSGAALNLVL